MNTIVAKKRTSIYKFIINWCACCSCELDVRRGKGKGRETRLYSKTDKRMNDREKERAKGS